MKTMTKNDFLSSLASECCSFNPGYQGCVCSMASGQDVVALSCDFTRSRVRFLLIQAKTIPLNDRLSLNPKIFAAIDRVKL